MRAKVPFAFLCAAFLVVTAFAEDPVDRLIQARMSEQAVPAVAIRIEKAGKVQKEHAYGFSSLELQTPVNSQTVFEIASATKSLTATLVARKIDEGKIALTDQISKVLPDLPEPWRKVTIYQLLSHTSGLPDLAIQPGREPLIAYDRVEAMKKLSQMELAFPPGTKWAYNQTNYFLLLCLLEKLENKPFTAIVRDEVFLPLHMGHSTYGDSSEIIPGRVTSYERDAAKKWKVRHTRFPDFLYSAAGMNTTVGDWSRWFNAVLDGQWVRKETLETFLRPAVLASGSEVAIAPGVSYGLGFAVFTRDGKRSAGHSGGGTAAFRYYPEQGTTIFLQTNGSTNVDAFLDAIADAYFGPAIRPAQ
jgi:CubicO group peptidase (beta-lactamase class C family)